jgi:predicted ABC-type ATPase
LSDVFIIGGPNGAGKTTVAKVLLPEELELAAYLNADEIARSISPQDVDAAAFQAGRLMLERMRELVRSGTSFAFETTFSGKSYLRLLKEWQGLGWRVTLIYLWLPSPEHSLRRVAQRVRTGGMEFRRRRSDAGIFAGLRNVVEFYLPLADEARIYDNGEGLLRPIAVKHSGEPLKLVDSQKWLRIVEGIDEEDLD